MAAGDLVTSAAALTWLGLSGDDGTVAALISAASTAIQKFIGYQIASATYTQVFNGNGSKRLLLSSRPVTAVSSVTVDTIPVPLSVPPQPGFLFDNKFVYLSGGGYFGAGVIVREFYRGVQNVTVSYTAGYANVPADIAQACLMWIASLHAAFELGADASVKMLRAGDTQMEFGNAITALQGGQTILMPPATAALLLPYRRVASQ